MFETTCLPPEYQHVRFNAKNKVHKNFTKYSVQLHHLYPVRESGLEEQAISDYWIDSRVELAPDK